MAIDNGTAARRLTAVPAVLLIALGVTAAPAAQAGQPRHAAAPRSGWDPGALLGRQAPAAHWLSTGLAAWRRGALAAGDGLPRAPHPAGPAADGWSVVPTPNPSRLRNGTLTAGSCSARRACTAVGSFVDRAGVTLPLAQRWNGTAWLPQPLPSPAGAVYTVLNGVSCPSATACTAVGYYFTAAGDVRTLAEAWDGTRWLIQPGAGQVGVASGFFAVSCTAASACTAVGTYDTAAGNSLALAERWDGAGWSVQPTPIGVVAAPSTLLGVSCAGPAACTAVGATDDPSGTSVPLALTWDGSIWHGGQAPAPAGAEGSGLSAVSCSAGSACTAAGSYDTASGASALLAERWDGSGWTVQHVPVPHGTTGSLLSGVSCPAAGACVAAGVYSGPAPSGAAPAGRSSGPQEVQPLAVAWNGSAWAVRAAVIPPAAIGGYFAAVSCAAVAACTAVGSFAVAASPANLSLAESWNGTAWRVHPAVSPPGANASQLAADSCWSARSCVAVGFYASSATAVDALAETWDGSRWRITSTPNPRGARASGLESVSCTGPRSCMAVGITYGRLGRSRPLAERWDGTRWTLVPVPVPAHGSRFALYGVSCSGPGACTAVGFYDGTGGRATALAERWDGVRWTVQALPMAAKRTWLFGVSCPSAGHCEAAGYLNRGSGDADPLAEGWNGARWSAQPVPLPAGSPGGTFDAVSCSSPRACAAGGAGFSSNGEPLGERWNGTRWHPRPAVAPPNYQTSFSEVAFDAVSCPAARSCTAVGGYTPGNESAAFAEAWHGGGWDLEFTAIPRGAADVLLDGISCAGPGCLAVGAWDGPSGVIVTLAEADR